jgi:AraC-like DNA-binding protein
MTTDGSPSYSELVQEYATPEEQSALSVLTNAYGLVAKNTAGVLAETLDLDESSTRQILEGVNRSIDGLNFGERKAVVEHLQAVSDLLGKSAGNGAVIVATSIEQPASPVLGAGEEEESSQHDSHAEASTPNEKIDDVQPTVETTKQPAAGTESSSVAAEGTSPREAQLDKDKRSRYESLLARVFDEELIEGTADAHLDSLLDEILSLYLSLTISRISKPGMQERVEQMRAYITGETMQTIGENYGVSSAAIYQGMKKAMEGIVLRVSREQLDELYQRVVSEDAPVKSVAINNVGSGEETITVTEETATIEGEAVDDASVATLEQEERAPETSETRIREFILKQLENHADILSSIQGYLDKEPEQVLRAFISIYRSSEFGALHSINHEVREQDCTYLLQHLIDGISIDEIAGQLGLEASLTEKRLQRVMTIALRDGTQFVKKKLPTLLVSPPSESTTNEEETTRTSREELFESIATALNIADAEEFKALKSVFDSSRVIPRLDTPASAMRMRLMNIVDSQNGQNGGTGAMHLTEVEKRLFHLILRPVNPLTIEVALKKVDSEGEEVDDETTARLLSKLSSIVSSLTES